MSCDAVDKFFRSLRPQQRNNGILHRRCLQRVQCTPKAATARQVHPKHHNTLTLIHCTTESRAFQSENSAERRFRPRGPISTGARKQRGSGHRDARRDRFIVKGRHYGPVGRVLDAETHVRLGRSDRELVVDVVGSFKDGPPGRGRCLRARVGGSRVVVHISIRSSGALAHLGLEVEIVLPRVRFRIWTSFWKQIILQRWESGRGESCIRACQAACL